MNTKFFHTMATVRKKRNIIKSLKIDGGVKVVDCDGLCNVVQGYFTNLFTPFAGLLAPLIEVVHARVSPSDNLYLLRDFRIEEFKEALYQMHPNKSLGLDGLNAAFYRRFWNLCGDDIFN